QAPIASPRDALAMEEVERTRVFASLLLFVDAFGLITLPFLGGNDLLRRLLIGAMAINFVGAAWIVRHLRRARTTTSGPLVALAVFATATAHMVILYWGVFSAAPTILVLGIYFFSRGQHLPSVVAIYLLCAGGQALWAVLTLLGVLPDVGLARTEGTPLYVLITSQVVLQFVFITAHVLARETRK